jgi:hypothetical protein
VSVRFHTSPQRLTERGASGGLACLRGAGGRQRLAGSLPVRRSSCQVPENSVRCSSRFLVPGRVCVERCGPCKILGVWFTSLRQRGSRSRVCGCARHLVRSSGMPGELCWIRCPMSKFSCVPSVEHLSGLRSSSVVSDYRRVTLSSFSSLRCLFFFLCSVARRSSKLPGVCNRFVSALPRRKKLLNFAVRVCGDICSIRLLFTENKIHPTFGLVAQSAALQKRSFSLSSYLFCHVTARWPLLSCFPLSFWSV